MTDENITMPPGSMLINELKTANEIGVNIPEDETFWDRFPPELAKNLKNTCMI